MSRPMLLLLGSDLLLWTGFFLLVPFLPEEMTRLGHSGTVVGAVLAIRLLCQQGTMPLSGAIADRWGYRRALLTGLGIRVCGFALMAVVTSAAGLAAAAVLSGLGGSLIGGAFKASYTAAPGQADLAARFLWLAVADRLGQILGPQIGTVLGSFAARAWVAVALFLAVAVATWLWLPDERRRSRRPLLDNLLTQFRNRPLVGLVAALCGYWALQQQMSVLIPLAAARLGAAGGVGTLFSLSALAGLVLVLLLPRIRVDRLWRPIILAQAVTAAAMAMPVLVHGYAGIILATLGLAVAAAVGQPAMDALVGILSPAGARASAYGFAALSFGVGGAAGQLLGGWAWSHLGARLPWLLFALLGTLTLLVLQLLRKGVDAHGTGS
ncbi:MAG: arabinose efflux permease family protein [Symbiobacteriaceae bacterium]|jgi:DHA1 family multidrug resistance protein-like MFS transporter|nr:arabinose efflux permease family protein [Symbiobacteriaceae bacterium]